MMEFDYNLYEKKYSGGYLDHYLAMYSINQDGLSNENFESHNCMYVEMEGEEEFQNLKNEVLKVRQQDDVEMFLDLAKYHKIEGIDIEILDKLFVSIENHQSN